MLAHRVGVWAGFLLVHAWLTYLGVVVVPTEAFYDVDLYRWWVGQGLDAGQWPVLDAPWVYPVGALLPMLLPGLVTTTSTVGYALAWCLMITLLDAVALVALTWTGGARRPGDGLAADELAADEPAAEERSARARLTGGWWWLGFLLLLGPVAIGRLDAVVVPLMVLALVLAMRSARAGRFAAALLTVGAWIKVAPGALLIPLAAAARRPVRTVVAPAAAVCLVVVLAVTTDGGLVRLAGFVTDQHGRGLQVESVAATGWVLAALVRHDTAITLNQALVTYEVRGPGTTAVASALDVVLALGVAAVGLIALMARRRGAARAALLPTSLVLVSVLIVTNKVGSPQLMAWLAAPLAVLLSADSGPPGQRTRIGWVQVAAVLGLVIAGLTQIVFPWGYPGLLQGHAAVTLTLAVRNVLLLALLGCAVVGLRSGLGSPAVPGDESAGPDDGSTAVGPDLTPGRWRTPPGTPAP